VVLDILDRLTYQALVDRLSPDLIGGMARSAFGWRLAPDDRERGKYSHNNLQWAAYRNHLALCAAFATAALRTDLVAFFSSIPLDMAHSAIDDGAPKGAVTRRLHSLLSGFDNIPERSGLPQRSTASAVLANMILSPMDDVLDFYSTDLPTLALLGRGRSERFRRRSNARWMDDMWLFGSEVSRMRRAQTDLQRTALSLGLNINSGKTAVFEGPAVAQEALQIEHSAVDDALDSRNDNRPLEELVDRLLASPESAGRTSLKFAVKRMRDHTVRYRLQEFTVVAKQMPHAADILAPLFKETFATGGLQDWFLDYASSDWASFDWSVSHYVRMFPSSRPPRKPMREYVAKIVADPGSPLPLAAVAAQRLAAWDKSVARSAIRATLSRTSHPQLRRVLVLAALEAGETSLQIRKWLRQEPENALTLEMLEQFNFAPPKIGANYAN